MWDVLGENWTKLLARIVIGLAALAWGAAPASGDETVVVRPDGIEPAVLRTTTGERVDFVNRTGRLVHVQFAGDGRQHEVVQIPGPATIWAVFHRPGKHPYEVHVVVDGRERALRGLVEVAENAQRAVDPPSCGVTVMGVCIER
jgi:plastocyanin